MEYTQSEVIQYVKENDVKFIKLFFTDIFGAVKSISVQPSVLQQAFSQGIPFDVSKVRGFSNIFQSDLALVPDPATLSVLPWRPQHGRVARMYCNIKNADGTPFTGDTRHILQSVLKKAEDMGLQIKIGTECEFYLFKLDEKGRPTLEPHDAAGYCDIAPLDKGENVRRDIILNFEQMGIEPKTSHHEAGPGQNEIDFNSSDALKAADNLATFKNTVSTIAYQDGLCASFLPHPLKDQPGNGLHIHIFLYKDGKNLLAGAEPHPLAQSFIAGILSHIADSTAFLNPVHNSYERLALPGAPKIIAWSHGNYNQVMRLPFGEDQSRFIDLRSPDPCCNQYTALALIIGAGLGFIEAEESAKEKGWDFKSKTMKDFELTEKTKETLPQSLSKALDLAQDDLWIKDILNGWITSAFFKEKRAEKE